MDNNEDDKLSRNSSNDEYSFLKSNLQDTDYDTNSQWNAKFMEAVRSQDCLWNKNNVNYNNNMHRNCAWRQIASKVNQTVEKCKEIWEKLRSYEEGDEFGKFETFSSFEHEPNANSSETTDYYCIDNNVGPHAEWIPKLIRSVREEELLWKSKHMGYSNKIKRNMAWQKISQKVKQPVSTCKSRWKTLREQFVRRLRHGKLFTDERFALTADLLMFIKSEIKTRRINQSQHMYSLTDYKVEYPNSISNKVPPTTAIEVPQPQPQQPMLVVKKIVPKIDATPAIGCENVARIEHKEEDPLDFDDEISPIEITNFPSVTHNNDDKRIDSHVDNMEKLLDLCENLKSTTEKLQTAFNKMPTPDEEFLRAALTLMQDLPNDAKGRIKNSLLEVILNERRNVIKTNS